MSLFVVEASGHPFSLFAELAEALDYLEILRPVMPDGALGTFELGQPWVIGIGARVGEYGVVLDEAVRHGRADIGEERCWTRDELTLVYPFELDRDPCPECNGRLWALMPNGYQCEGCFEWFEDDPDCEPVRAFRALRRNRALT